MFRAFPGAVSAVEASAVLKALSGQPEEAPPSEDSRFATNEEGEVEYQSVTGEWRDAPESITSYSPQSGPVFGILNQLLTQFQEDLQNAQTKEESAQVLYADVKKTKDEE